jgi:ribonuclease HII
VKPRQESGFAWDLFSVEVFVPSVEQLLRKSVKELRELYFVEGRAVPTGLLEALKSDPRRGAGRLAELMERRTAANRREAQRLRALSRYETELWEQGCRFVAGVDEAGMAPLAGPVVAAAVILSPNYKLRGLDDSKKIADEERRETLAHQIRRDALSWSVGRAEVEEIDSLNIYRAGLLAMKRAVDSLTVHPDFILVDARTIPHCPYPQRGIIHGDALSASIAAASIIAKTTRDAYMRELDRIYSGYGFASHKGYPTPEHLSQLRKLGVLPVHRRSFAPVREVIYGSPRGLFDQA